MHLFMCCLWIGPKWLKWTVETKATMTCIWDPMFAETVLYKCRHSSVRVTGSIFANFAQDTPGMVAEHVAGED